VTKNAGFDEEITVNSLGLPPPQGQQPTIPPANGKIPKGQTQVKLELKPAANAPLGSLPLAFTAKTKFNNKDYTAASLNPVMLGLPFDLQVHVGDAQLHPPGLSIGAKQVGALHAVDLFLGQPRPLVLGTLDYRFLQPASSRLKVKVVAVRKGGYKGPIALEARNLPANVTAPKVTIPENQNEIELELAAAANAALGAKPDVNILGTATALGNQQNASGNFTITVVKR
jgi:hypothetical protein